MFIPAADIVSRNSQSLLHHFGPDWAVQETDRPNNSIGSPVQQLTIDPRECQSEHAAGDHHESTCREHL